MMWLLDSAFGASAIIAVGLVAAALLRKRSAAVRHWVLAASIVCAVLVPLLRPIAPTWNVPVNVPAVSLQQVEHTERGRAPAGREEPRGTAARVPATSVNIAAVIWLAGMALGLVTLLGGLARLAWLASRARTVTSGPWFTLAAEVGREYGLRRSVTLLHSSHPALLMTWGVLRPRVMLPATALEWSHERIRIVLRHELAHIRRYDWLLQLTAEALRLVYWFNPLIWIACRRLRDESEHACDDAVLSLGVEGHGYAEHLLELARSFKRARRGWSPAPAIAHSSNLEKRIHAMLYTRNRTPFSLAGRMTATFALLCITVAIAGFGAGAQTPVAFSGSVVDPHDMAAAGAAIILTNTDTNVAYTASTDANGQFQIPQLPPGAYTFQVKMPGFREVKEPIVVAGDADIRRQVTLVLGTIRETVTVADDFVSPRDISVTANKDQSTVQQFLDRFRGKPLQPPMKLIHANPAFPSSLRGTGWSGQVVMTGRIATDGTVKDLTVVESNHADASKAAMDAVKQWQFAPTRLHGTATDTSITVTIDFKAR